MNAIGEFMAKKSAPKRSSKTKLPNDKLLPRLTIAFFDKPLLTGLLWLVIIVFGTLSYTTFLKREGFPSVSIPLTIVSGTYVVNDPAKVDTDIAKPLSDTILKQDTVKSVQTQSSSNFFVATIQYKDGVDAKSAASNLQKAVENDAALPKTAQLQYSVPYFGATGGEAQQIDVAISFYDKSNQTSVADLTTKAQAAASSLDNLHLPHVQKVFVRTPFEQATDPTTGQQISVQRTFDRFGERQSQNTEFYDSVIIGVAAQKGTDVIKLDHDVREALQNLRDKPEFQEFEASISASFAPSIKDNLSELQRVLLEGLLAILVVGSIVIAVRASLITVISMITVLLTSLGFLYLIGYTLNVITLFALILGLALIVDDTIIMVEAIDAARQRQTDRRQIILEATRKISRAMVAATATAALSFTPLLFAGGVLGQFIRAIPITLIASLFISLLVALLFIPFFSRFLLLGKKQLGKGGPDEFAAGFEARLAHLITRPMQWARHSRRKLNLSIIIAVVIGLGFVGAGLAISRNVVFNIFPPTKDTNGVALMLQFPQGTTVTDAQAIAGRADDLAANIIGANFVQSSYYGSASAQMATLRIELTPYSKRKVTSPQLVKELQERFNSQFKEARTTVSQVDVGPPVSAFVVQIEAENRPAARQLGNDLSAYLSRVELKRPSGKVAHLTNLSVSSADQYVRQGNKPLITVSGDFDGSDTTTLVNLGQEAVKKEFPNSRVGSYGLTPDAINFDLGQESDNQDSFRSLALAFPIVLVVIYVLLVIEFRSLLQPLLIFLGIPFSIFGVMLGLYLTHNAISFFALLGFFALIGLSIKNTILLTDYANQARNEGKHPIDAAIAALEERFRPLFATSMTAVVSLIPLAIASPFWEGLAVVLIFGLLSSTFLVIVVFPYYYIGGEFLRSRIRARTFIPWALLTAVATWAVARLTDNTVLTLAILPLSLYVIILQRLYHRRLAKATKA
jgi:multidrug efflux pump subunit AcrB